MADVPPTEPAGPQIGADEWVARSGERSGPQRRFVGHARLLYERVPKPVVFAAFVLVAVLIPIVASQSQNDLYYTRVGTVALVFALLALGLNVAVGFAGLLDLGYIAYYGVGAYGYAMLSSDKFGLHWQAWLVIPLVVLISATLGFLLALPSRRLVGDYLAIVTLFFGQIFYVLVNQGYRVSVLGLNKDLGLRPNWDLTGGPNGIANVDRFRLGGLTASSEHAYLLRHPRRRRDRVCRAVPRQPLAHGSRLARAPRRLTGCSGHEHAGELAEADGRRHGSSRRRARRDDQRSSPPGRVPGRLQHAGPDHHLRDGDPRRGREPPRGDRRSASSSRCS